MARPTDLMRTQQLREEYGRRAQASMVRYMKLKGIDEKLEISRRYVSVFKEEFMEFVSKNGRIV